MLLVVIVLEFYSVWRALLIAIHNGCFTSKPVKLKRGFGHRDAPSGRDRTAAGRSQQAPDRELRKRRSARASWGAEEL
jgi:hypothetical protein